ncbi:MAG TPA: VIT domain-containing protein [Nitrospirales bacterium]|nr:VIT domain-containing protein [Nitrospirales bacterium]
MLRFLVCLLLAFPLTAYAERSAPTKQVPAISEGSLISVDADGKPREFCPLTHTDMKAEVTGFLARVTVTQRFENPSPEKIEAVYTFPLPQRSAVDRMTLRVGDRTIEAKIKRREEAQALYDAARTGGRVAGLLEQERPNIFTQSVANILPGEHVTVTISYVEILAYEAGTYELVFPMVVGPRYMPAGLPDAARIAPPVTPEGTRAGHDVSIDVTLDAGVPLDGLASPSHDIDIERPGPARAHVVLRSKAAIPNKDFILRYDVAGRRIQDALLTHRNGRDGFFTLILQPPDRVAPQEVAPKELVFVLDTSGSMSGFPIEKAKETMRLALQGLYARDTFNLITFAGDTHILFPHPVPATPENLHTAHAFLESRHGGGGTEMMKAIRAALDPSDAQDHIRIVCFMTDGYVGNDMEIIAEVKRHPNARVFSFGIGSAVNRFLLDGMAAHGRGEVEYVGLQDDGSAAARRFHERVRNPLLTDITVDWGGLPVSELYPKRIPDLFGAKPVIVHGRYQGAGHGTVRIRGMAGGRAIVREVAVDLPATEARHDVLATLWARTRVEDLMAQDYAGIQQGRPAAEIKQAITKLGLDYRLLTHYTSFVAVEEVVVTDGGAPRRIDVPVEMPEGVSYQGVFGNDELSRGLSSSVAPNAIGAPASPQLLYKSEPKSSAERRADQPRQHGTRDSRKLDAALERLATRLAQHRPPAAEETQFVKRGQVEVQVWLTDASAEAIEALRNAGLIIVAQPRSGKLLVGRLPIEMIETVSKLPQVRYVSLLQPLA